MSETRLAKTRPGYEGYVYQPPAMPSRMVRFKGCEVPWDTPGQAVVLPSEWYFNRTRLNDIERNKS